MSKPESSYGIRELLSSFLTKNKLQSGIDRVDAAKAWEKVMGPGIMSYTTSVHLEKNRLRVSLRSSVLRQELMYGREKIIENLNEELGKSLISELILQ